MVSPGPSVRMRKDPKRTRRVYQSADLREGVTNAYTIVKEVHKLSVGYQVKPVISPVMTL